MSSELQQDLKIATLEAQVLECLEKHFALSEKLTLQVLFLQQRVTELEEETASLRRKTQILYEATKPYSRVK